MIASIDPVSLGRTAALEFAPAIRRREAVPDCRRTFALSSASLHELLQRIHLCGCSGRNRLNFIQALLAMEVNKLYSGLGYSTIALYAEKNFGCRPFQTYDYLKLARALVYLPLCRVAYVDGTIGWPELRLIACIATGETEKMWVEFAATHSLTDLEAKIRAVFDRVEQGRLYLPSWLPGSPYIEVPPGLYA